MSHDRTHATIRTLGLLEHLLTNAVEAEKGHVACIDLGTGSLTVAAAADADLFPIGYFDEDKTGTGTNTVRVQLFEPIMVHVFTNEGADAGRRERGEYLLPRRRQLASTLTDTNAIAGRVAANRHPSLGADGRWPGAAGHPGNPG